MSKKPELSPEQQLKTQRYIDALVQMHTVQTDLKKDLEVTGAVQTLLLPKKTADATAYYQMDSFYRTASQSGGDWWWYDIHPDGGLTVMIADVTGHGAGSAMVTATVASAYRILQSIQATSETGSPSIPHLAWIFEQLNKNLFAICSGQYEMALSAIQLSPDGTMQCWCAGAPPVMIMPLEGAIQSLFMRSTFLGSEQISIATETQKIEKGTRLLLFTDGAYEFPTPEKPTYGMKSLRKLLASTHNLPIAEARQTLSLQLESARFPMALPDDLTFILIDRI